MTQVGILTVAIITMALPGALAVSAVTRGVHIKGCHVHVHIKHVCVAVLLTFVVTVIAGVIIIPLADHIAVSLLFAAIWGVALGAVYNCQLIWYSQLQPGGREAEFSGLLVFWSKLLTWAPNALYSAVLLITDSMEAGLSSIVIWFVIAVTLYLSIKVQCADEHIKHTVALHMKGGGAPAAVAAAAAVVRDGEGAETPLRSDDSVATTAAAENMEPAAKGQGGAAAPPVDAAPAAAAAAAAAASAAVAAPAAATGEE